MSGLETSFTGLTIDRTPSLSSRATLSTIICSRSSCSNVVSRARARTVKLRKDDSTVVNAIVCSGCFKHYLTKGGLSLGLSSSLHQATQTPSVNYDQIQQNVTKSWRNNQSLVMPVSARKAGRSKQPRTSPASQPHHVASLVSEGWAPGPVGEGTPYKLPPLIIALPEKLTAPLAQEHYKDVRDHLHQWVHAGGHDAIVVLINARMQTLAHGKARPNI
ncbi:hypothetical protein EDB92DRAFT_2106904, partial [Lactarius akahatsu]